MYKKIPIKLAYCIDTDDLETKNAVNILFRRLSDYFSYKKYDGFEISVFYNYRLLIITINGEMEIDFTLADTTPPYHPEIDGESSYDCSMTKEEFDKIIINAFEECAKDIIDVKPMDVKPKGWREDFPSKTIYLSESINEFIMDYNTDIGYPTDEDIWKLLEPYNEYT